MAAGVLVTVTMLTMMDSGPQAKEIWLKDYGKALEQTKALKQPLLIVLESAENPQATNEKDKARKELLDKYVLCRVDVSEEYGRKVAAAFKVSSFPHTAIIDRQGKKILYRKTGKLSENEMQQTLSNYQSGQQVVRHTVGKVITNSTHDPSTQSYPAYQSWSGSSNFGLYLPASACPT